MDTNLILYPLLPLVLLTFVVGGTMYRRRVAEMRAKLIRPREVALSRDMAARLDDQRASDNFRNLFEVPVLFYAAILLIYAAGLTDLVYVVLAWAFVASRVVHSAIHCTYNKVMHRLPAFATGLALVAVIWARIAWDLLVDGLG